MFEKNKLFAHTDKLELLKRIYKNNIPHALIFNGIKGIGKHKTAIDFIKSIHSNSNTLKQNFFEINSDENVALIDDIRNLIVQTYLTNSDNEKKCFILIDNADHLNSNSYNALLKTIEEPPKNTIIIIICHNFNKIPKTIISRCMKIDFRPLKIDEIRNFCDVNKINLESFNLDENFNLIGGSIEKLLIFSNSNGIQILGELEKLINLKEFNVTKFEIFFNLISKDYDKNFKIISSYIHCKLKKKFLENFNNRRISGEILKFFSRINLFTGHNINIDKKKELHFLLTEYIDTNIYE
tara:strand:- start:1442 stop:2329 length:888 start_codon:yes stop_codon:yes gene_type:complete